MQVKPVLVHQSMNCIQEAPFHGTLRLWNLSAPPTFCIQDENGWWAAVSPALKCGFSCDMEMRLKSESHWFNRRGPRSKCMGKELKGVWHPTQKTQAQRKSQESTDFEGCNPSLVAVLDREMNAISLSGCRTSASRHNSDSLAAGLRGLLVF